MNLSAVSDLLNPVLVKELRQGLKTRTFMYSFLLMQGVMAIVLFFQCLDIETGHGSTWDGGYWLPVAIPLLVILPVVAINAIYSEHKRNTLQLVFLTRLTPWRIVTGKWASLMAQCGLITCAVLPYTVLRYFLGGVNIADDLLVLALIAGGSALLCAGGLLLSTVKNPWRAFWILFSIFIVCSPLFVGLGILIGAFFYGTSGRPGLFPLQLLLVAAALLHAAAARYTNYTFDNRVAPRIHTITTLIGLIAAIQIAGKFPPALLALPILLPALFNNLHNLAPLALPEIPPRRRTLLVHSTAAAAVLALLLAGPFPAPGRLYLLTTLVVALAFPAAAVLALRKWIHPFVPMLVFVQIMALLIGGTLAAVLTNELKNVPAAFHFLPVISFLLACFEKGDANFLGANFAHAAGLTAALLWQFRTIRRAAVPLIG